MKGRADPFSFIPALLRGIAQTRKIHAHERREERAMKGIRLDGRAHIQQMPELLGHNTTACARTTTTTTTKQKQRAEKKNNKHPPNQSTIQPRFNSNIIT